MSQTKVDRTKLRQATQLAQPFDPSLIQRKPGNRGADYVSHPVVQQRFMFVTGAPTTSIVRELHSTVRGKPDLGSVLVSVLMRMELVIDGELHVAEEYGSCEHPENEAHDGERAKKAASDAYKRCAMRIAGVGLHLWCKNGYTLGDRMIAQDMKEDSDLIESDAVETEHEPEGDPELGDKNVVASASAGTRPRIPQGPTRSLDTSMPPQASKDEKDDLFERMQAIPDADHRRKVKREFVANFGDLGALPAADVDVASAWVLDHEDVPPPRDVQVDASGDPF